MQLVKPKQNTRQQDNKALGQLKAVLRPITGPLAYPTPAEIIEAKLDGQCPRCGDFIDCDGFSGLCHGCGFSY